MKLAIIKCEDTYSVRMNDYSGKLTTAFLSFVRNLVNEIGKSTDGQDFSFSIGVTRKDVGKNSFYNVFEVPDYIGYLILEYQRELRENFNKVLEISQKEESELNPS
jgi:hypothetical protein